MRADARGACPLTRPRWRSAGLSPDGGERETPRRLSPIGGEGWGEGATLCTPDLLAYLYDWSHDDLVEDVALYTALAAEIGGPALELGCGTGRVLAGPATAGLPVCGVDSAPAMLRRARVRLGASPSVRLVHGNMRAADVPGPFGTVLFARSALGYVRDWAGIVATLRRIGRTLSPGGLVVIDQANLAHVVEETRIQPRCTHIAWDAALTAHVAAESVQSVDPETGLITISDRYVVRWGDRPATRLTDTAIIRAYPLEELTAALYAAGLAVRRVYGDYGLGPYRSDSERLLVLAGRN